ncbi:hypothetical protein KUCAC02_000085 [Chaenocephalus aceratus]|nr:hypothetical protein KUCAC02_000085 [Chaenocephalus aceratus]
MAYADIMAKSCHDEEDEDEEEVKSFEEKEMEKQKLLYQQARLHDRGAAEMVLQTISASKGEMGPMVASTLKLGIAILNGGNSTVQQKMLDYLKDKKDVGFFQSLAGLMQSCSVLDLNAFERQNKAEGLGMVTEEGSVITHERGNYAFCHFPVCWLVSRSLSSCGGSDVVSVLSRSEVSMLTDSALPAPARPQSRGTRPVDP